MPLPKGSRSLQTEAWLRAQSQPADAILPRSDAIGLADGACHGRRWPGWIHLCQGHPQLATCSSLLVRSDVPRAPRRHILGHFGQCTFCIVMSALLPREGVPTTKLVQCMIRIFILFAIGVRLCSVARRWKHRADMFVGVSSTTLATGRVPAIALHGVGVRLCQRITGLALQQEHWWYLLSHHVCNNKPCGKPPTHQTPTSEPATHASLKAVQLLFQCTAQIQDRSDNAILEHDQACTGLVKKKRYSHSPTTNLIRQSPAPHRA